MEEQEDVDLSAVVARADALMQRRRQPGLGRAADNDDLPVLTEVVPADPAASADAPPALDPALLDTLARELARRMQDRLATELPGLVEATLESTLDGLIDELRHGFPDSSETAIRDFLARRGKLEHSR